LSRGRELIKVDKLPTIVYNLKSLKVEGSAGGRGSEAQTADNVCVRRSQKQVKEGRI
jgi:hypothetical protein